MRRIVAFAILALALAGCTWLPGSGPADVYWAEGRIVDGQGRGVGGVTLLVQPSGQTVRSSEDGTWVLTGLRGTVTIVPQKEGYTFEPASRTLARSQSGIVFRAVPGAPPEPAPEPEYNPCADPNLLRAAAAAPFRTFLLHGAGVDRDAPTDAVIRQTAGTPIMGPPAASREQARRWLTDELARRGRNDPWWLELVDMYYDIGPVYNVRPDVALAQAALETGYFGFGNLVHPWQNNFAGIAATGTPSDGNTPLRGADPARVCFRAGVHGAIFASRATGVEAQIQHLYAYATTAPLPAGTVLVDPRFVLVPRGVAPTVEDLSGRWATGPNYGQNIVNILNRIIATP